MLLVCDIDKYFIYNIVLILLLMAAKQVASSPAPTHEMKACERRLFQYQLADLLSGCLLGYRWVHPCWT